jgi:hypothetical protein
MAVAANENDIEPRTVSFKGAKQTLTAFAPKIEAARPEDRESLIDAPGCRFARRATASTKRLRLNLATFVTATGALKGGWASPAAVVKLAAHRYRLQRLRESE